MEIETDYGLSLKQTDSDIRMKCKKLKKGFYFNINSVLGLYNIILDDSEAVKLRDYLNLHFADKG